MRPASVGWLLVTVALAFLMGFYVRYCLGLASFWLVDSGGVRGVFTILSGFFSGALIPLVFLPRWLQVLQFFLPFQYMVYVPAMVFTGSYSVGGTHLSIPQVVGCQAVAVAVMFLLSEVLHRAATRRFTDSGS
jgi:ABC-2 type transport system permease protein